MATLADYQRLRRMLKVVAAATGVFIVSAGSVTAQVIQGVVHAGAPPVPQVGIEIRIIELNRGGQWETKTDVHGRFVQERLPRGRYSIWVRVIGYRPSLTVVEMATTDTASVMIELEPLTVELTGVTVYGLSVMSSGQEEFWSRRDKPWVQSVDYEQIAQMRPGDLRTLVGRLLPFKTRCGTPLIYIDGLKQNFRRELNDTPLAWVYGVEVFRTYYDIPTRYRDSTDPHSKCGAVFIWKTVRGQVGPEGR